MGKGQEAGKTRGCLLSLPQRVSSPVLGLVSLDPPQRAERAQESQGDRLPVLFLSQEFSREEMPHTGV